MSNWKDRFPKENIYFKTSNGILYKFCIVCGNKIFKKKGESLNRFLERKFCSRKCYGIYRKENVKGNKNPNWKGGFIKKICLMYGNEFIVRLRNKNKKYFGYYR